MADGLIKVLASRTLLPHADWLERAAAFHTANPAASDWKRDGAGMKHNPAQGGAAMLFTVAICTLDRCASLAIALQSIESAARPTDGWELLVVDNGSTDATQAVIASFAQRLPIRSVLEPRRGLAIARNTAVAAACGDYIIWTDDDVRVSADWIAAYIAAFAQWPDAALFGGRIVPVLQEPVSAWCRKALPYIGGPLAARDLGSKSVLFRAKEQIIPFGANFAMRAEVARLFPFDVKRGAGTPYTGEETTAFENMLAAGHQGRWVATSHVEHLIDPGRQTRRYVSEWYERLGFTVAWSSETFPGPRLFGAPRWLLKRALTNWVQYTLARAVGRPDEWAAHLIAFAMDRGRIKHCRS